MVIHKQEINYHGENIQKVLLPRYSEILSCDFQGDKLVIWYAFSEVYTTDKLERKILVLRTGEPIKMLIQPKFIGTAYDRDPIAPFVIHLFEIV